MYKSSTAISILLLAVFIFLGAPALSAAELSRSIFEEAKKYELDERFQNHPILKMYSELEFSPNLFSVKTASLNPLRNILDKNDSFADASKIQSQINEIEFAFVRKNILKTSVPIGQFENPTLNSANIQSILFPDVTFTNCHGDLCQGTEKTPLKIAMNYDVLYKHLIKKEELSQINIPYTFITYQQKNQIHSAFIQLAHNFDKIFSSALNIILVLKEDDGSATLVSYQIFLIQKGLLGDFATSGMISEVLSEHTREFVRAIAGLPRVRQPASLNQELNQELDQKIDQVILRAHDYLDQKRLGNDHWNFYSNLGDMYISQFLLFKSLLDTDVTSGQLRIDPLYWRSPFDQVNFKKNLLAKQLKDGSWEILHDGNSNQGDINATIYHYAALKIMGEDKNSAAMKAARNFILKKGGIASASLFTKIMMALTGNASWNEIPTIPYLIFDDNFLVNKKQFGQWIGPHVMPIGYLKKVQYQKKLGPSFDLSELWIAAPRNLLVSAKEALVASSYNPDDADKSLVLKMLQSQKAHGSLGGYTLSTMFTLLVFDHYKHFNSDLNSEINSAVKRGSQFVEELYFNSREGSYKGITCDGTYWDTALIAQGLLDSRYEKQKLESTAQFLLNIQDKKSGGFGFGKDFEQYMDTDDTAEILTFMHKMNFHNADTTRGLYWLFSMQNTNGGWGAFDKNNNGNLILKIFGKPFEDSADLFDESSTDVTGHVLESLGLQGYNIKNSNEVRAAVKYLDDEQVIKGANRGAWLGRWGLNYIYGTSAAVIGLKKVGVSNQDPKVARATSFLLNCQNEWDGGFGESFLSYSYPRSQACHGLSTPSQTAWALNALIEVGLGKTVAAKKAAAFLVNNFERHQGQWIDADVFVGTGHPRIVPMDYPSYPWAFSLMALGRYREINQ